MLEEKFLSDLLDDIHHNRLALPTLPEIALKVRKVVDDPNATTAQIAKVVAIDVALSARLIQVANSPMLRGLTVVNNLQSAIARLGHVLVRNLVTSLVMEQQMHLARNPLLKTRIMALWQHSTQVAAISHVLAAHFTTLKPDEAMLGGLIHGIGTLPILMRAAKFPELIADDEALDRIITRLHTQVGKAILEAWAFPEELIAVVSGHEDLERDKTPEADYTDVVMIANLQSYICGSHRHSSPDWEHIPALAKLGLSPEVSIVSMEETARGRRAGSAAPADLLSAHKAMSKAILPDRLPPPVQGAGQGGGRVNTVFTQVSGRICGNSSTSRMEAESVSSITRRSMPIPSPAVGGIPYSSARM